MKCLVFDIETVPDVELGRRALGLEGIEDERVAQILFQRRRELTGGEFLSLEQQRIVAISVVLSSRDTLKVWSLGEESSSEKELIERFFDGIDRYTPDLVSWNGAGFDLPVLHYRALKYGIAAPRYWEVGDEDQAFRWNNYLNRFHWRHLDLMDVLSGYQGRARAGLESVALLLGLPGKLGMGGDQVWDRYQAGELKVIRDYCETDVINTYLVYLRFELIRGKLAQQQYEAEVERMRQYLTSENKPHFNAYLEAWSRS
jgi:predicted PolB exonuclease-like 3'-5' exonuclease